MKIKNNNIKRRTKNKNKNKIISRNNSKKEI